MNLPENKSASFDASFAIKPEHSQAALITLLLLAGVSLIAGFIFLWYEKNYALVPFFISLLFVGIAIWGWHQSQRMIDMNNPLPTKVSDGNGNSVSTDTRVLDSVEAMENLGNLLQTIGAKRPLPKPDGIVGDDGSPIPDSGEVAQEKVDQINSAISKEVQNYFNQIVWSKNEERQNGEQLPEEAYDGLIETNCSDSK